MCCLICVDLECIINMFAMYIYLYTFLMVVSSNDLCGPTQGYWESGEMRLSS